MQLNKSDEYTRTSPRMGSQLLTKPRVVTVSIGIVIVRFTLGNSKLCFLGA